MPGGILNILATGNQNVFLTGNPKKTFFKAVYAKYTNFGLQKFRIDFNGLRTLRMSEDSLFTFKIPRYGDLLMDSYLVVTLPHIWSPIKPPTSNDSGVVEHLWRPYEFKWIKNLGTQINVGYGEDFTVKDYYEMISNIVGFNGNISSDLTRPVGMKRKLMNNSLTKKMGWKPIHSMAEGIEKTYHYYLNTIV